MARTARRRQSGGRAFNHREQVSRHARRSPSSSMEPRPLHGFTWAFSMLLGRNGHRRLPLQSMFSSPGGTRLAGFKAFPAAISAMVWVDGVDPALVGDAEVEIESQAQKQAPSGHGSLATATLVSFRAVQVLLMMRPRPFFNRFSLADLPMPKG